MLQGQFICATREYCRLYEHIPAPYIRKEFSVGEVHRAELFICGIGFYDVSVNGRRITKGKLAPYISNPDHIAYFDRYDITQALRQGENAIGVILGNGFANNIGGEPWGFEKAHFRSSPKLCLTLVADDNVILSSDTTFRWAPSPIAFDDIRCGEYYDARLEQPGWDQPGFDDSHWQNVLPAEAPKGERKLCTAEPVVCRKELLPVSKEVSDGRLLFDFGANTAGVCHLKYKGEPGQKITLWHCETLVGGTFYHRNTYCPGFDGNVVQKDILICSGREDVFEPRFTFHGFRYVFVEGIYPYNVAEDFLTLCELSSDLPQTGSFTCSDETVNRLQSIAVNSDRSNFFYFPIDCPQREKNGWTGDAALSAEQMLYNFGCANSLTVWLDNIRKAQRDNGMLPGVVPTDVFGYEWGNGPAWDCVLVELPWQIYHFTGDQAVLEANQDAIYRYIGYLKTKINENGLLGFGLGDWLETGKFSEGDASTPVEVTDTLVSIDLLQKSEFVFRTVNKLQRAAECRSFREELIKRFRKLYLTDTLLVRCATQTAQAKAIDTGIFTEQEKSAAFERLLELIQRDGGHFKVGIIGGRVLFRVLAENGQAALAHRLITQDSFPSYKYWLDHGATTLWEGFHEMKEDTLLRKDGGRMLSLNHHCWGDISAWFYRYILGICINPNGDDPNFFAVRPCEIPSIDHAQGGYSNRNGSISVAWKRENGVPEISVAATGSFRYTIIKEEAQ